MAQAHGIAKRVAPKTNVGFLFVGTWHELSNLVRFQCYDALSADDFTGFVFNGEELPGLLSWEFSDGSRLTAKLHQFQIGPVYELTPSNPTQP